MVSHTTIAVAGVLQFLGVSFFVSKPKDQCSPAPSVGAHIFLLAILFLLWDGDLIPQRYKKTSPRLFAFVEILATVFITELVMFIGWCAYERMAFKTARMICRQPGWCEYGLLSFTTIVGALITMCIVAEVVCPAKIKDSVGDILEDIPVPLCAGPLIDHIQDIRSYVMGAVFFSQLTRQQRFQAIRAFQMQLRLSEVPNQESQESMCQDDPDEQAIGTQQDEELEEKQLEAELEAEPVQVQELYS